MGLEFNLRKLRRVAATALVAAPLAILLMVFAGYQVGQLMGWTPVSSLFLGAIISIASTSVIVKVLREMKRDREPFAGLIYGILIVEDLLGVVMIVLLTGIASTGDLGLQSMAASTGKLLVFLVTVLVVGLLWCRACSISSPGSRATSGCSSPCWGCALARRWSPPSWASAWRWGRSSSGR